MFKQDETQFRVVTVLPLPLENQNMIEGSNNNTGNGKQQILLSSLILALLSINEAKKIMSSSAPSD